MSWCGGTGYIARPFIPSLLRQVSRYVVVVWMNVDASKLRRCTARA